MKILKGLLIILLLNATSTHAQYASPIAGGVDVGVSVGSNSWAPSMMYHEEIGPQKLPWLRFGVGFRVWGLYGGRANLYTERIAGTKDYLEFRDVSVNGLSAVAGVNVSFWKLDIGVNTDLLGLTYGSKRHGYYEKNLPPTETGKPPYDQWVASKPTVFNALPLVLRRNTGQSEAFVRFKASRKLGVKLGYACSRLTYTTKKIDGFNVYLDNNQRHVSKVYGLPYVALAFALGN